jgi:hypothetical protein
MKRLNSFKNFEAVYLKMHNSEDCFKDRINFKMIDDIKDMALEYLDEGFALHIDIFFRSSASLNIVPICYVSFSHDKSKLVYEEITCLEDNLKFVDINYRILLLSRNMPAPSMSRWIHYPSIYTSEHIRELIEELKSRISEAYPKEIIC